MLFGIILISVAAALIAAGIYVCSRYGVKVVRCKIREVSSRILIVIAVFFALLLATVYCYDYISVLLKDVLSAQTIDSLRETVKLFFGTTSIFASVKALLLSCVMLGLLSCITFGFGGMVFMPQAEYSESVSAAVNAGNYDGIEWSVAERKSFLSYSGYIS